MDIYIYIFLKQFQMQMLKIGAIAQIYSVYGWQFLCYNSRASISNHELESGSIP